MRILIVILTLITLNCSAQDKGRGRHFAGGLGVGYAGSLLSLPITGGEPEGLFWGGVISGVVAGGIYEGVNKWATKKDDQGNTIPHGNANVSDWAWTALGGVVIGVAFDTWIGPRIDEDYTPYIIRPFKKRKRFYSAQLAKIGK